MCKTSFCCNNHHNVFESLIPSYWCLSNNFTTTMSLRQKKIMLDYEAAGWKNFFIRDVLPQISFGHGGCQRTNVRKWLWCENLGAVRMSNWEHGWKVQIAWWQNYSMAMWGISNSCLIPAKPDGEMDWIYLLHFWHLAIGRSGTRLFAKARLRWLGRTGAVLDLITPHRNAKLSGKWGLDFHPSLRRCSTNQGT